MQIFPAELLLLPLKARGAKSRFWVTLGATKAEAAAGLGDVRCLSETPKSKALKRAITTNKAPTASSAELQWVPQEHWHSNLCADGETNAQRGRCQKLPGKPTGEQGNPRLCSAALAYHQILSKVLKSHFGAS